MPLAVAGAEWPSRNDRGIVGEEEGKKVLLLLLRSKCEVILPSSSAIEGGRSPLPLSPGSQSGVDTVLC